MAGYVHRIRDDRVSHPGTTGSRRWASPSSPTPGTSRVSGRSSAVQVSTWDRRSSTDLETVARLLGLSVDGVAVRSHEGWRIPAATRVGLLIACRLTLSDGWRNRGRGGGRRGLPGLRSTVTARTPPHGPIDETRRACRALDVGSVIAVARAQKTSNFHVDWTCAGPAPAWNARARSVTVPPTSRSSSRPD